MDQLPVTQLPFPRFCLSSNCSFSGFMDSYSLGSNPRTARLEGSGHRGKVGILTHVTPTLRAGCSGPHQCCHPGRRPRGHADRTGETGGPAACCLSLCSCDVSERTFQPSETERHGESEETAVMETFSMSPSHEEGCVGGEQGRRVFNLFHSPSVGLPVPISWLPFPSTCFSSTSQM